MIFACPEKVILPQTYDKEDRAHRHYDTSRRQQSHGLYGFYREQYEANREEDRTYRDVGPGPGGYVSLEQLEGPEPIVYQQNGQNGPDERDY